MHCQMSLDFQGYSHTHPHFQKQRLKKEVSERNLLVTNLNKSPLMLQVQEFEAINGLNSMPYSKATEAVEKMKSEKDSAAPSPAGKDKTEPKEKETKGKDVLGEK